MPLNLPSDLLNPAVFPHPADHIECIETHISWVILAGDYAYKIKKPLDLGFLDFSTLAKRRAACEEELRINRRTAPMLYEAMVGIGDNPVSVHADTEGSPIEYAVRMRRFPQSALLAEVLADSPDAPTLIEKLANHVADFHAAAAIADPDGPYGTPGSVHAAMEQNFTQLRSHISSHLRSQISLDSDDPALLTLLDTVAQWNQSRFDALQAVFAERLASGWVRECHGDLHLGNIMVLDDQPRLFDALEFNPALRWIDVMADVAFLVMDLHMRGRADLSWHVLNTWLEKTGDYAGLRLLPYYLSNRAIVRAKVAAIRLEQLDGPARDACLAECRAYLELAASYTIPPQLALIITHGISGSGKTTHSQHLVDACGLIRIRSDVERKRLFDLAATQSSAEISGGIYTEEANQLTQTRLEMLARTVLDAGYPVLVDATFIRKAPRERMRDLAQTMDVPLMILAFVASPTTLRARAAQRAVLSQDASEADAGVVDNQLQICEGLDENELKTTMTIDTEHAPDWERLLPQFKALWARSR